MIALCRAAESPSKFITNKLCSRQQRAKVAEKPTHSWKRSLSTTNPTPAKRAPKDTHVRGGLASGRLIMCVETLPSELQLKIASHLQLRELILLRNSSRHRQALINNNLSFIRRARRELLCLWDDTVRSPYFLPTRQRVTTNLRHFDRARYLAAISRAVPLPEQFELWVLEWPAKAVIGWTWPGLDRGVITYGDCEYPDQDAWWQLYGTNCLSTVYAHFAPPVFTLAKSVMEGTDANVWLERREYREGDRSKDVNRDVIEHDAGMAIPVWLLDPDFNHATKRVVGYLLVVSGLGPIYDCLVQPFQMLDNRSSFGARMGKHLDRESLEQSIWQEGVSMQSETKGIIRASTWVEWLRCHLKILETEYDRYKISFDEGYWDMVGGLDEWRFRVIDLEHMPKVYS